MSRRRRKVPPRPAMETQNCIFKECLMVGEVWFTYPYPLPNQNLEGPQLYCRKHVKVARRLAERSRVMRERVERTR